MTQAWHGTIGVDVPLDIGSLWSLQVVHRSTHSHQFQTPCSSSLGPCSSCKWHWYWQLGLAWPQTKTMNQSVHSAGSTPFLQPPHRFSSLAQLKLWWGGLIGRAWVKRRELRAGCLPFSWNGDWIWSLFVLIGETNWEEKSCGVMRYWIWWVFIVFLVSEMIDCRLYLKRAFLMNVGASKLHDKDLLCCKLYM